MGDLGCQLVESPGVRAYGDSRTSQLKKRRRGAMCCEIEDKHDETLNRFVGSERSLVDNGRKNA